jgi:hypothetical protein
VAIRLVGDRHGQAFGSFLIKAIDLNAGMAAEFFEKFMIESGECPTTSLSERHKKTIGFLRIGLIDEPFGGG